MLPLNDLILRDVYVRFSLRRRSDCVQLTAKEHCMRMLAKAAKYTTLGGGILCFGMLAATSLLPCQPEKTGYMPGEVLENLPSAQDLNSIDEALRALPRFKREGLPPNKMEEALTIERLVRAKFRHGYSKYTFCENWIAYFAGRFIWEDLSAKIDPEDVMEHPYAACSQQGLVVQELLRRRGFEYATVGVPPDAFAHFASAVKISGKWYYIDSWGPLRRGQERLIPLELILSGKSLNQDFVGSVGDDFRSALQDRRAYVRSVNRFPASRGLTFQKATFWFSNWGWCVLLTMAAIMHAGPKIRKRMRQFISFGLA
jgi:hypothetical protein